MQAALTLLLIAILAQAPSKPRARDLGIPFEASPGPRNAITDVAGVEVGLTTLIAGDGPLQVGKGPVRTGVTAILPRGRTSTDPVMAGWFSLNGNSEMTGTTWIKEGGFLEGRGGFPRMCISRSMPTGLCIAGFRWCSTIRG